MEALALVATAGVVVSVAGLGAAAYAASVARRLAVAVRETAAACDAVNQRAAMLEAQLRTVETRVEHAESEVRLAAERVSDHDARLQGAETQVRELSLVAPPPPIPIGRTAGRLEDLRATLRAQAAEAAEAAQAPAERAPEDAT